MAEVTVKDIETLLNPLGDKLDLISNRVDWGTSGDNTVGKVTEKLKTLTQKLGALLNVQINAVKNDAAAVRAPDQALAPLNQIAAKLDLIYGFIKETFKPTGLGSEDDNKGMLERREADPNKEVTKAEVDKEKSTGSAWVGGTIAAAALMALKEYLEETWTGLAQRFLKPFVAVQLAIKGLPKSLKGLNTRFVKLAANVSKWFTKTFPRLSKIIKTLFKPIQFLVTKVKGLGKSITSAVKNFKFSKFFAPLTKWLSKLGGTAGFGKLFKWMSPIGGLLKKLALPVTLVLETVLV